MTVHATIRVSPTAEGLPRAHRAVLLETRAGASVTAVLTSVLVGAVASTGSLPLTLGAVALCASALLAHLHPVMAGLTLAWAAPISAGLDRGLLVPGFKLSEVLIVGAAAVVLTARPRGDAARFDVFDWWALIYVGGSIGLGLSGLLTRGGEISSEAVSALLGPLQYFLLYRVIRRSLAEPHLQLLALKGILIGGALMGMIALLQQVGPQAVSEVLAEMTGSSSALLGRATGPFPIWHDLAGYLFLVIAVALGLLLHSGQTVSPKRSLVIVVALSALGLVTTLTLVAILGALIASVGLGIRYRRTFDILVGLLLSAAAAAVLLGPVLLTRLDQQFGSSLATSDSDIVPQSVAYRLEVWTSQYFPVLKGYLLTGYGPGLPPTIFWQYTESLYLSLLLRGGLPLLVIFLALALALIARVRQSLGEAGPNQSALATALLIAVPVYLVMNFINPYFLNVGSSHLLWVLAGLLPPRSPDIQATRMQVTRV